MSPASKYGSDCNWLMCKALKIIGGKEYKNTMLMTWFTSYCFETSQKFGREAYFSMSFIVLYNKMKVQMFCPSDSE